ncbi:hypothetical protein [Streptomyces collinus]|uniref:hypothetical protein n=1 Tax=Streptomyces collinus TaxID=42684 RepID=UPI0033E40796
MHAYAPGRGRSSWLTVAAAFCGLVTVACGAGSGSGSGATPESSTSHTTVEPAYMAAYNAGWRAGRRIFDDGGKGAAVREVVWGGCVRRSLTARPHDVVDQDRGAWVLGCRQGVGTGSDRHPPAGQVTRREPDPDLLRRFRSWAAAHGEQQPARYADQVVLIHLGERDYDVEVTGTYTDENAKAEARRLADAFTTWWDGDDGDGRAWNLIVTDSAEHRLSTRALS